MGLDLNERAGNLGLNGVDGTLFFNKGTTTLVLKGGTGSLDPNGGGSVGLKGRPESQEQQENFLGLNGETIDLGRLDLKRMD